MISFFRIRKYPTTLLLRYKTKIDSIQGMDKTDKTIYCWFNNFVLSYDIKKGTSSDQGIEGGCC